jgi:hypothetical protein
MTTSAASFIDQIKAEYREVVKAETSALPHAIRCGEFLNLAKENLKAERGGKWKDWLETNCPEIAQETASLYRRLAEHKAKLGKAKSIREARELLPKAQPRGAPPAPKEPQASSGFDHTPPKGPAFEEELEVRAPDELFTVLVQHWQDDELEQLVKMISDHLQKKRTAAAARPQISTPVTNSPAPTPPSALRRL